MTITSPKPADSGFFHSFMTAMAKPAATFPLTLSSAIHIDGTIGL